MFGVEGISITLAVALAAADCMKPLVALIPLASRRRQRHRGHSRERVAAKPWRPS